MVSGGPVQAPIARFELGQHLVVLVRAGDDGHGFEILGRGAHHGGSANVDVLDRVLETAIGIRGDLFEGIEVDHRHVDARDVLLRHHGLVGTGATQQAAVYLGVQGFYAPAHNFRRTGVVGDLGDFEPGLGQRSGRPAGAEQAVTHCQQPRGEFDDAGFVRHAEQRQRAAVLRLSCHDFRFSICSF